MTYMLICIQQLNVSVIIIPWHGKNLKHKSGLITSSWKYYFLCFAETDEKGADVKKKRQIKKAAWSKVKALIPNLCVNITEMTAHSGRLCNYTTHF